MSQHHEFETGPAAPPESAEATVRIEDRRVRSDLGEARAVLAELRGELLVAQQQLETERVAARRARMQAAALEAELGRRRDAEHHLRSALQALTAVVRDTQAQLDRREREQSAPAGDGAVAIREHAARVRAEEELSDAREELAALRKELGTLRENRPPLATDPETIAGLRAALSSMRDRDDLDAGAGLSTASVSAGIEQAAARLRDTDPAEPAGDGKATSGELAARGRATTRGAWMRDALTRLAGSDQGRAEQVLVALLSAQAGSAPQPLTYGLEIAGGGRHRVSVMPTGAAVGPAADIPVDARVRGSLAALTPLATGGASRRLTGTQIKGRRRLRPVLRARRAPLQLSDLAALHQPVESRALLDLLAATIPGAAIDRALIVDVDLGDATWRLEATPGAPAAVRAADARPADATLTTTRAELPRVLDGDAGAAVSGERSAATALLGWFDRARESA